LGEDFPALLAGFGAGALVAGYRLEAQVGAGGMAVVYRARDERLGRLVALKVLAPGLAADEESRRRFIAESRSAAAVDDPHIIPVYEAGEAGGVLFIAMRFVPGRDLRAVLAGEGPLDPKRVADFISPVASALDAAHRAGLVHRDVKPANILVDERPGRAPHGYLSDFGVSKGAMSSAGMTASGVFLGTPDYAAPEQIQGLAVDGRADQYALACVAYQLLTGVPPFQRDQGMAVLFAHMSEPPPPLSARRPGLPAAADQVLARALAKVPEKRYGSCREFAGALRDALAEEAVRGRDTVVVSGEGAAAPVRSDWVEGETIDAPVLRAALAFGPGATTLAVGSEAGGASAGSAGDSTYLWDTATRKATATLADPASEDVMSVAFGPGGTTLATGNADGSVDLWRIGTST
jgi:serine/threonine protein kinase